MKIDVKFAPDIVALMRAEVAAGQKAVSTTMAQAGASLKSAWRTQITGAGLGQRLANTIRQQTYPKGRNSLDAAALVWSNAPVIIGAHDTGPLIRSASGLWLAIPTRIARLSGGIRARKLTPGEWERKNNRRLEYVYQKGKNALLVDVGNAPIKDQVMGRNGVHRTARKSKKRYEVIFILVRQVKLPKRLDLARDAERAQAAIPGSIVRNWVEDHL